MTKGWERALWVSLVIAILSYTVLGVRDARQMALNVANEACWAAGYAQAELGSRYYKDRIFCVRTEVERARLDDVYRELSGDDGWIEVSDYTRIECNAGASGECSPDCDICWRHLPPP